MLGGKRGKFELQIKNYTFAINIFNKANIPIEYLKWKL